MIAEPASQYHPIPQTAVDDSLPTGTSAPLLTNPSLTDMLSSFSIWPQLDEPTTTNLTNIAPDTAPDIPQTELSDAPALNAPGHSAQPKDDSKSGKRPIGRPRKAVIPCGRQRGTMRESLRNRKRGRPRGRPPNIARKAPIRRQQ